MDRQEVEFDGNSTVMQLEYSQTLSVRRCRPRSLWFYRAAALVAVGSMIPWAASVYRQYIAICTLEARNSQISTRPGPDWLRNLVGRQRLKPFEKVIGVTMSGDEITDDELVHLKSFPYLQTLNLSRAKVTDAGLNQLREVRHLKHLSLSYLEISDAGLSPLADLGTLNSLTVGVMPITNGALRHLKDLPELRFLNLFRTRVTVQDIATWKRTRARHVWPTYSTAQPE